MDTKVIINKLNDAVRGYLVGGSDFDAVRSECAKIADELPNGYIKGWLGVFASKSEIGKEDFWELYGFLCGMEGAYDNERGYIFTKETGIEIASKYNGRYDHNMGRFIIPTEDGKAWVSFRGRCGKTTISLRVESDAMYYSNTFNHEGELGYDQVERLMDAIYAGEHIDARKVNELLNK